MLLHKAAPSRRASASMLGAAEHTRWHVPKFPHAAPPSSASKDALTSRLGAGSACDGASQRSSTAGTASRASALGFCPALCWGWKGPNAASQPPLTAPAFAETVAQRICFQHLDLCPPEDIQSNLHGYGRHAPS